MAKPITYSAAGVDIDEADEMINDIKGLVRLTSRPGADVEIGGFAGFFDLKQAGYVDPLLVSSNDGVGTKVKIAIETGVHNTIGIDLVAMCVNDLVVQGAEPLFFLDYFATGHLDKRVGVEVIKGIVAGCKTAGAALIGGETAAMPGLYHGKDYDLAGFVVGAVERDRRLPREDVIPGDVILGLGSSGAHSNGFSLIRKIVANLQSDWSVPAPFAPTMSLGEALLVPTRIYVSSILETLKKTDGIKALAHITGGGLPDNVPRVLPGNVSAHIELSRILVPEVFKWLAASGPINPQDMLRTFNCGIGMVVIVAAEAVDTVTSTLTKAGESVFRIGEIKVGIGEKFVAEGALDLRGA